VFDAYPGTVAPVSGVVLPQITANGPRRATSYDHTYGVTGPARANPKWGSGGFAGSAGSGGSNSTGALHGAHQLTRRRVSNPVPTKRIDEQWKAVTPHMTLADDGIIASRAAALPEHCRHRLVHPPGGYRACVWSRMVTYGHSGGQRPSAWAVAHAGLHTMRSNRCFSRRICPVRTGLLTQWEAREV
jgi:hypothetical protein